MTSDRPFSAVAAGRTIRLGATPDALAEAGARLAAGQLVAFPTETVYGLGADATNPEAIARLYAAKGRPQFNPLIAHVPTREAAFRLGVFSETAHRIAEAFWPGPLTIVVPVGPDCPVAELARAGLPSLAIRVPDHPIARDILVAAGRPIAAPSANRSGHVSPTLADHVLSDLGGMIDAIVEGGPTHIGVESTIVACLDDKVTLLRPGGIPRSAIEQIIGRPFAQMQENSGKPIAPGLLASHYAPRHPLRLNATLINPGEACLGFGLPMPPGADSRLSLNLSPKSNLIEAASNLYRMLRELDSLPATGIAVAPVPMDGIGEAICDRLARAAAPRGA